MNPKPMNPKPTTWLCAKLPITAYDEALNLQRNLVASKINKTISPDIILLLEHLPVFTLGRRGGRENLTVSREFLEKSGIQVIQVERGGDITFHGPGQIVCYPIVNLKENRIKVVDYVTSLEEVMIRTAVEWGITAKRNSLNRGIWVGDNKLGSIGIAIRRGISFHGFAYNVNISLKPFEWTNPCGLEDIRMTSMEQKLSQKISMNQVYKSVKRHIEEVFEVDLIKTDLQELMCGNGYEEATKKLKV
jgi:lipoate-protein ligase B